jgi:hypothetical protein
MNVISPAEVAITIAITFIVGWVAGKFLEVSVKELNETQLKSKEF